MSLRNCVMALSLMATLPSSADIYRCQTGDGKWLFTDRQCNNGTSQIVTTSPLGTDSKPEPEGLSEAEQKALTDLDQRMAELREFRIRQRAKHASQIKRNNSIKQQNCALATRQLARIQDKKSHGYKLSEAPGLDQQIRELVAIRRVDCR